MSRTFFLDTSALIKLYHQEAGTERVEEIFRQAEDSLIISELAIVELYTSFARKVRTGEVTLQAQEEALRNFEDDCAQRFVIEPLGSAILHMASVGRQGKKRRNRDTEKKKNYSDAGLRTLATGRLRIWRNVSARSKRPWKRAAAAAPRDTTRITYHVTRNTHQA